MDYLRGVFKGSVQGTRAAIPGAGATIMYSGASPYNLSLVLHRIVTTVQKALSADQKVILLMGEEHCTIAHVRMAELVRAGLSRVGVNDPVMAYEHPHNLLEILLPEIFPGAAQAGFRTCATQALPALKACDPGIITACRPWRLRHGAGSKRL